MPLAQAPVQRGRRRSSRGPSLRHQGMRQLGRQSGWPEDGLRQGSGCLGHIWNISESQEGFPSFSATGPGRRKRRRAQRVGVNPRCPLRNNVRRIIEGV